MIGAPNTRGQKYWVHIVQWAPETSVSEEIVDIFRNYNIDCHIMRHICRNIVRTIKMLFSIVSNSQAHYHFKQDFQRVNQHAGGRQWKNKNNLLLSSINIYIAIAKSFEWLAQNRLIKSVEKCYLIYGYRYPFQRYQSPLTALVILLEQFTAASVNSVFVTCLLTELQKQKVLLNIWLDWIQLYLTKFSQMV